MADSGIEITKDLTIPKLFLRQCRKYGRDKVAMREKEFGIWRPFTWQDYYENVKYLCLGMVDLGLKKGDKVAMIGDNRPEGLWAEMAAMCGGGVGVWLFQDCMMDEVRYIIDHSDTSFFLGETQEEVDKALSIKDQCPKLKWIVWDDPKGMRSYHQDFLISIKKLQERGKAVDQKDPGLFERLIEEGHGDDICLLFYTSGTTALPKGALLSHWNMLTMGKNLMAVDPCYDTDDFVSYLPFAWIGEQMMSISCGLQMGYTINFPEEPDTAQQNIREIGPHVMFAPPRLYEGMTRSVQVKYIDATRIKRKIYEFATKVGYKVADLRFEKKPIPLSWKISQLDRIRDHAEEVEGPPGHVPVETLLHGRRRHGAGSLPVLPRARGQSEADLRPDRDRRDLHRPQGRRREVRHGGATDSGDGGEDHRRGRDHHQESIRVPGLLQERRGDQKDPCGWVALLGRQRVYG